MKPLMYKGFKANISFEMDSGVYVGRIVGISDIITFESDTIEGLDAVFYDAVDDYISHKKLG